MSDYILPANTGRVSVIAHLLTVLKGLSLDHEFIISVELLKRGQKRRSLSQNALQRKWHQEAADELKDESAEDKRAYCKLHFGVPILRAEDEQFRASYDRVIRPMPYETKLELMKVPFDFPVTRLMTVKQKTRYLDAIHQHYSSLGVRLTQPDAMA